MCCVLDLFLYHCDIIHVFWTDLICFDNIPGRIALVWRVLHFPISEDQKEFWGSLPKYYSKPLPSACGMMTGRTSPVAALVLKSSSLALIKIENLKPNLEIFKLSIWWFCLLFCSHYKPEDKKDPEFQTRPPNPSRFSGRARLRRALTGQIELASAKFHDPAVQLNRFVSKGTVDSVILGFLCRRISHFLNCIFYFWLF